MKECAEGYQGQTPMRNFVHLEIHHSSLTGLQIIEIGQESFLLKRAIQEGYLKRS